jgi:hypothetical protein
MARRAPRDAGTSGAPPSAPPPAATSVGGTGWWGKVDVPRNAAVRIAAGPTRVWVERRRQEWRVFSVPCAEGDDEPAAGPQPVDVGELPDGDPLVRFCFADAPERLVVSVAQADRPVVVRPETPLSISPGEKVTLFVSTPVWMVLAVERTVARRRNGREPEQPEDQRLIEVPLERPSDTWFGPNTRVGELCYAAHTAGYLQRDALPRRPHLAVTPVSIENKATDPLQFERLQVPLPQLGVYVDTGGALWTNAVQLARESNGDLAAVRVESGVPLAARGASERLAKPRTVVPTGSMVRAFSRLLHMGAT